MLNIDLQKLLQTWPDDAVVRIDGIVFTSCGYEGDQIDIDNSDVEHISRTNEIIIQGVRQ